MDQSEVKPFGDVSNNEEDSPFYIKMSEHNLNYDSDPDKPILIKDTSDHGEDGREDMCHVQLE